jgi:hypothetical protein
MATLEEHRTRSIGNNSYGNDFRDCWTALARAPVLQRLLLPGQRGVLTATTTTLEEDVDGLSLPSMGTVQQHDSPAVVLYPPW